MNKYEAMLIVRPNLDEQEAKKISDQIKEQIKDVKNFEPTWYGIRKMAYQIAKFDNGYYLQLNFEAPPASIMELRRLILLNKSVIRFMVFNLEKSYGYRSSTNEQKKTKLAHKRQRKQHFDSIRDAEIAADSELAALHALKQERKNKEWNIYKNLVVPGATKVEPTPAVESPVAKEDE